MSEYILIKSAYNKYNKYYSAERQDEFIANLLEFKKSGSFVDIGSAHSDMANNSKFFDESLNWKGICIDRDDFTTSYSNRNNTKFYCGDATILNYKELFEINNLPKVIDYLSLDADIVSNEVLKILPSKEYTFSSITIEHDYYSVGDSRRKEQRQLLSDMGYHLLCADVSFIHGNVKLSWEDWWIHPQSFDMEKVKFLQSDGETNVNIISRFGKKYE